MMTENNHLPVVIVDDDVELLHQTARLLRRKGWEVTTYEDLVVAMDELAERRDPFVLIVDHDFGRSDGKTGMDLVKLMRTVHPWGPVLPIPYSSGRITSEDYLDAERADQLMAPSVYFAKASDTPTAEVVMSAEQAFFRFQELFEQQALHRALLNWGDEDLEDVLDEDGDDRVEENAQ